MKAKTPMDTLLGRVKFKCMRCGAAMGTCDCWRKCSCGLSYPKDGKCRNPKCSAVPQDESTV